MIPRMFHPLFIYCPALALSGSDIKSLILKFKYLARKSQFTKYFRNKSFESKLYNFVNENFVNMLSTQNSRWPFGWPIHSGSHSCILLQVYFLTLTVERYTVVDLTYWQVIIILTKSLKSPIEPPISIPPIRLTCDSSILLLAEFNKSKVNAQHHF